MSFRSALYVGHLAHARADADVRHAFRYPIYMACLDLDELPALARSLRLFSYNRPNLFALHDRDYAGAAGPGVAAAHAARIAAAGLAPAATTRLVTQLRVAHYVFNPVSFFLGYDAGGALVHAVAEVNNNYGGNHPYVLGPAERAAAATGAGGAASRGGRTRGDRFRVDKTFFVSPFIHGPAQYDFRFDAPADGARLDIGMRVRRPDDARPFFVARLEGRRVPLGDRALAWAAARYPLMTLQVIGLIYWEAVKMHVAGVPFRRPGPDHAVTAPPPPRGARAPAPAPDRSGRSGRAPHA